MDGSGLPAWAVRLRDERRRRLWSKKDMAVRLRAAAEEASSTLASRDGLVRMIGYWEGGERQVNDRYRTLYCRVFGMAEAQLFDQGGSAALAREAELFDTMELARVASASDLGVGALEGICDSVDLLCRAYPSTHGAVLRDRTRQRLGYVVELLGRRLTLAQHRDLLVQAGWLAALLGCVHYDLGQFEDAEAARQAAHQMGSEAGHDELRAWALEMAAWFALVDGRYEDVVALSRAGQRLAGSSNAQVQLILQEAKGHARLGDGTAARDALSRGSVALDRLPLPDHPDHHFVFDHPKWVFYAATVLAWLEDDEAAEEHARAILTRHIRPDGTSPAPMRVANARIDLALVQARRGELDAAVGEGVRAFEFDRRSLSDLVSRGSELANVLRMRYPGERLADDFHERLAVTRRGLHPAEPPAVA
jgi:tetratricopeptide (TPR) repeat protein